MATSRPDGDTAAADGRAQEDGDGPPTLVGGPTDAVATSPELAPRGARRTTSITISRAEGFAGRAFGDVRGRDVRRFADGELDVVDTTHATVEIDAVSGELLAISADGGTGGLRDLRELRGANLRRGYARMLVSVWPDGAASRPLLYSALEDLGGAFLVSGYAPLREGRDTWTKEQGLMMADAQEDVCAGWVRGGGLLESLRLTGRSPVPIGPATPPITATDGRWHEIGEVGPSSVQRLRRLDVTGDASDAGRLVADAHLRDAYEGEEAATVMHEYLVRATFDGASLVLADVEVDARVFPWDSCPAAVPSAGRLVGARVSELPARVRAEMVGPSTCTHLNSTMRSLADVDALRRLVPPAG